MISKNQIKLIQSLQRKKNRDELGLFVAEGEKLVRELLPYFEKEYLFTTDRRVQGAEEVSEIEMGKITHLSTASNTLAVFKKKEPTYNLDEINSQLSLLLDDIQDPGNVGTIIRIADWFGIKNVFCSAACADIYNSKTVKATMGALSRVSVIYVDVEEFLRTITCPIYGTFMDGKNIYQEALPASALIVMGNEGNGISDKVEKRIKHRLSIPSFGENGSESLNVAIATGIVCSEFRRSNK